MPRLHDVLDQAIGARAESRGVLSPGCAESPDGGVRNA